MNLVKNLTFLLIISLVAACGGGSSGEGEVLPRNATAEEKWQADVTYMVERMTNVHPSILHSASESEFGNATQALVDDIGALPPSTRLVRILELFALPATQRDGHMSVSYYAGTDSQILPLKFYQFEGGVYLIDALSENTPFIGAKLIDIEGLNLDEVNERLDPLLPRDNQQSLETARVNAYLNPFILHGLGISNTPTMVTFTMETSNGQRADMQVLAVSPINFPLNEVPNNKLPKNSMMNYIRPGGDLWVDFYEQRNTIHIKLNTITDSSQNVSLGDIASTTEQLLSASPSAKVILDLRQNGGGNNQLVPKIIDFLQSAAINIEGKLHVFTDRQTFSAAGNLVAEIDHRTLASFWGVSPGGSGTQYGDSREFRMPNSGMLFNIPTRFWQFGDPSKQPLSQPMDYWVDQTIDDYLANVDTLLMFFFNEID
ncbi:MAG: hypothetical protein Alis3KO_12740 [Aliiglaciecola sp.]